MRDIIAPLIECVFEAIHDFRTDPAVAFTPRVLEAMLVLIVDTATFYGAVEQFRRVGVHIPDLREAMEVHDARYPVKVTDRGAAALTPLWLRAVELQTRDLETVTIRAIRAAIMRTSQEPPDLAYDDFVAIHLSLTGIGFTPENDVGKRIHAGNAWIDVPRIRKP